MKKVLTVFIVILFINILLPYLIIKSLVKIDVNEDKEALQTISVYIAEEDKVVNMNVNQYLKEVVAAEMPASFHSEALKAQAVAARTYLINRINAYKSSQFPQTHKGAYICTDATHCKAWISEEKRRNLWGENQDEYWNKISDAVDCVSDLIITYNSEPISAVFHSTSSGYTENAKDVWGSDVSYLVSGRREGDEIAPKYSLSTSFPINEFKQIAEKSIIGVNWNMPIIGDITRSDAGGIKTITIGGVLVSGKDFRFIYGLRSTNIEFEINENEIILTTKGYGHGVGMSQYGANYLANQGKTFEDILKYYYTDTELMVKNDIFE